MRVRDVMTTPVRTVDPDTSVRDAGELMADGGYAALPVLDEGRLVGLLTEADVLRNRLADPPLLGSRGSVTTAAPPPLLVGWALSDRAASDPPPSIGSAADVADLAGLFLDEDLRSVPVVDDGELVGIVSRRDLVRALVRPDDEIAREIGALLESGAGQQGGWQVTVCEGMATIRPGVGGASAADEAHLLRELARTVTGVVGIRILPPATAPTAPAAP